MNTPKEIARWVIDNRWPKNENEKISDVEMYHTIVDSIQKLRQGGEFKIKKCYTCEHEFKTCDQEPCCSCSNYDNYEGNE